MNGPSFAELDAANQATPTDFSVLDKRMAFASDGNAVAFAQDSRLHVRFYNRQAVDEEASIKAGRAVHKSIVCINIKLPGDKHNDVNRAAMPTDFQRFPVQYQRFQQNQEQIVGSPLSVLPFLTETQVEDYKAVNVRTVEQLAGMPDVHCQTMMGSVTHKRLAAEWLQNFNGAERVRAEMSEQLAVLRAELDALKGAKVEPPKTEPTKTK